MDIILCTQEFKGYLFHNSKNIKAATELTIEKLLNQNMMGR